MQPSLSRDPHLIVSAGEAWSLHCISDVTPHLSLRTRFLVTNHPPAKERSNQNNLEASGIQCAIGQHRAVVYAAVQHLKIPECIS